jgi:hypothetical protein
MSHRIAWLLALSAAASAQWLHYPTAGIPRTRDGKPNLTAPAPRTHDHKPDLSGMWLPENDPKTKGTDGEPLPKLFVDFTGGLKPEEAMREAAATLMAERQRADGVDDPLTTCKPLSAPRLDSLPSPIEIVQNPGLIVFLHEFEAIFRKVHTDGRKLPEDPQPTALGYSVGKWEGQTLVVDTIGFQDQGWLDVMGHPHSDALHVTERFRRLDVGHMEIQITIDDPKTYKKPFTVMQKLNYLPDTDLLEYHCAENERDIQHFVK